MHVIVHVKDGIDLVDRTEIAEPFLISQQCFRVALVRDVVFVHVTVVISLVALFTVLCSTGDDVWRRIFPRVTGSEIIDPALERANGAGDYLSHRGVTWPQ